MPNNPRLFEPLCKGGTELNPVYSLGTALTLRDLFAAFALAGLLAGQLTAGDELASTAYEAADDMLAERERAK